MYAASRNARSVLDFSAIVFSLANVELDQTLRRAGEIAVTLAPNAQHKYSDLAYQLLGAIVTRVSGIPYADYMQATGVAGYAATA